MRPPKPEAPTLEFEPSEGLYWANYYWLAFAVVVLIPFVAIASGSVVLAACGYGLWVPGWFLGRRSQRRAIEARRLRLSPEGVRVFGDLRPWGEIKSIRAELRSGSPCVAVTQIDGRRWTYPRAWFKDDFELVGQQIAKWTDRWCGDTSSRG
jgi:hypothetical protein